jgi:hypothetical protein
MNDWDEGWCDDADRTTVVPYRGPIIRTPDIKGALDALERNADALIGGDYNPVYTRELLDRYLGVCRTVPLYRHLLQRAVAVLSRHRLAIPNGYFLGQDDPSWAIRVRVRLAALGAGPGETARPCVELDRHLPDHLWFTYADGDGSLWSLDYFSQSGEKALSRGAHGQIGGDYRQCGCGVWHRPLAVF